MPGTRLAPGGRAAGFYERAERQLGRRFDVRVFHDAVRRSSPLPVDVLERQVEERIAATKKG